MHLLPEIFLSFINQLASCQFHINYQICFTYIGSPRTDEGDCSVKRVEHLYGCGLGGIGNSLTHLAVQQMLLPMILVTTVNDGPQCFRP